MLINMRCLLMVISVGLAASTESYEDNLTKLWSMSGASNSDGSAVLNVTSASLLIQPTSYSGDLSARASRESKLPFAYKKYAFKPRAIPLRRDQPSQVENVYYAQDDAQKYKPELLFPGNYIQISKEKSDENLSRDTLSPLEVEPFQPKPIPLMMGEEIQKRSLDLNEEPIIEKPEGFSEAVASRRSISDYLGVEEDELEESDEEEEDGYEEKGHQGHKGKGPHVNKYKRKAIKKGTKKLSKYMLPLLLAYKLKFFALVPLLVGGLILLVGATGLAGFFFALFAAVMGLQKGGY